MKKIIAFTMIAVFITACSTDGTQNTGITKSQGGSVLGAIAGGILGSQIGKGSGQLIATGAGTLLGALAGAEIGKSLDKADMLYAQAAFDKSHDASLGETITWSNPETNNRGSYTPIREGRTTNDRPCRQYEQTIIVDGRAETGVGTACRNSDGTWEIING